MASFLSPSARLAGLVPDPGLGTIGDEGDFLAEVDLGEEILPRSAAVGWFDWRGQRGLVMGLVGTRSCLRREEGSILGLVLTHQ